MSHATMDDFTGDLRKLHYRPSIWDGNVVEEGQFISNGHIIWKHNGHDRSAALRSEIDKIRPVVKQERAEKMWSEKLKLNSRPVREFSLWRDQEKSLWQLKGGVLARLSNGRSVVWVNAQYLRLVQLIFDYESLRITRRDKPVLCMYEREVLALVMPLRPKRCDSLEENGGLKRIRPR